MKQKRNTMQSKKDNVESTNKYLAPVEEKIHNAEALLDKFSFNASQSEIGQCKWFDG